MADTLFKSLVEYVYNNYSPGPSGVRVLLTLQDREVVAGEIIVPDQPQTPLAGTDSVELGNPSHPPFGKPIQTYRFPAVPAAVTSVGDPNPTTAPGILKASLQERVYSVLGDVHVIGNVVDPGDWKVWMEYNSVGGLGSAGGTWPTGFLASLGSTYPEGENPNDYIHLTDVVFPPGTHTPGAVTGALSLTDPIQVQLRDVNCCGDRG